MTCPASPSSLGPPEPGSVGPYKPGVPASYSTQSREPLTPETAARKLRHWQQVLRLQDWDIEILVTYLNGMHGQCEIHSQHRKALIRLDACDGDTAYYTPGRKWEWEKTLVHEILHIHMRDIVGTKIDWESAEGVAAERMVETLAVALVTLSLVEVGHVTDALKAYDACGWTRHPENP